MKKLLFIPLSLATIFVSAQTLARKAVFSKGQQLERTASIKMNFGMEMMGQAIDIANDNTITSLVEVKTVTNKDYAIASTVKHVVTSMNGMGQEMHYDSDKKEDASSELGKKAGEMVGKTSNLTIDTKGYITASDDTSANTVAGNAGGFMGIGGNLANTGNKVGNSYDLVANLPAKVLKTGDTWVDSTVSKEGKTVTNYTVTDIKGDEAVISMEGTVAQSGETEANGMTINVTINGKSKGQYSMEVGTGIVKKRTVTMDATGTMDMMGQSVPFTMKLTMDEGVAKK